jgi:mannosyl-3-phosphoglycerate phosphatase
VTIGLGDSPNDLPMLETVDIAIVIKSGRSSEMKLNNKNVIFSKHEGPLGWNEEMLSLLAQQGV